ncbi:hypothetical protein KBB96_07855 [Luteolibacter ambystomatis]|uniref:Uncharacterized protein n=1 Tax=Luteolibacter ambystomatis TaxID=2824561 RepID=A0A975PH05_9BACT|nr:thrombospondin type 3 repeat-containing protein [Luteolibacter ambystomatis]QUE52796.1 hypothetical protein KBB96_07855 [Luteolibacter ambystomatis]
MKSLLLLLAAAMPVFGQMTSQPQAILTHGAGDTVNLDWQGLAARSYFLQYSEDLRTWNYFPAVELGADETISYGFSSTADKFFVRLQYTDEPTDDPENADFDGDGLTNLEEISIYHTKPFAADTDDDGLSDGYEVQNDLDPKDDGSVAFNNGLFGDPDGDGISNLEEQRAGTNPQSAADFPPNIVTEIRSGMAHVEVLGGGTPSGEFSAYRYWHPFQTFTANDNTPLTPLSVAVRLLSKFNFDAIPENIATATHIPLSGDYRAGAHAGFNVWTSGSNSVKAASLLQTRFWVSAPMMPTNRTFKFLKRERSTSVAATQQLGTTGTPTQIPGATTIVTLSIPAYASISTPLTLEP